MFFSHIPAGFLCSHLLTQRNKKTIKKPSLMNTYILLGLLGSVLPDFDIAYKLLLDPLEKNHHHYWTHIPIFWLSLWLGFALLSRIMKNKSLFLGATILFANALLHLVLDTIVGNIMWLYPLSDKFFAFFTIAKTYEMPVLNYIIHWTFIFEIIIITWAFIVFIKSKFSDHIVQLIFKQVLRGQEIPLTETG